MIKLLHLEAEITKKACQVIGGRFFIPFLITIGILLRLKHYLENRSLWLDEAWLSFGVSSQSFKEIFKFTPFSSDLPLPPIGFSLTEKTLLTLLGNNEYILRLFPFLCSIAALFLFHRFLKIFTSETVVRLSMALFALSDPLIYYAAEVKQYACDVLIALVLFIALDRIRGKQIGINQLWIFGITGVLALCFSHAAFFILASGALLLTISHLLSKQYSKAKSILCCGAIWMLGFALLFSASLKSMVNNPDLVSGALSASDYAPWPFLSIEGLRWLVNSLLKCVVIPLNIWPFFLCFIFYVLGQIIYFIKNKERSLLLNLPLVLTVTASLFHKYPLAARFVLFSLPMTMMFVAIGIRSTLSKIHTKIPFAGIILIVFLFFNPVKVAAYHLTHSRENNDIRTVMKYFKQHYRNGDSLYVNNSGSYAYYYYQCSLKPYIQINPLGRFLDGIIDAEKPYTELWQETHIFRDNGWFLSVAADENNYVYHPVYAAQWPEISRDQRTWILMTHAEPELEPFIVNALNNSGHMTDKVKARGASLYLYDLTRN